MPTFPTRAWMEALCERVVAQPQARSLAETLDGVYAFVVEPAGPVTQRHRYDLAIRPHPPPSAVGDGGGAHAEVLDEPVSAPQLVFTARFDRWWQLITGELDPRLAIVLRRLKISGDAWRIGKDLGSAKPLLDALGEVETRWPE